MKATAQIRHAADLIQVTYHGQGVTYRCRQCGCEKEANAYYEADHKEMIYHVNITHSPSCMKTKTKEETNMTTKKLALQQYGEREALSEMVHRVKHCVPNGKRLKDAEVLSLAQVALATGLDPFTGEIWYIPGKGPMAGIKGLRRRAREQSLYSVYPRFMSNSEMEDHSIELGDVGRICELSRFDVLQKAVEINKMAGEMVIPVKPILGVGIWRKGDQIASSKSKTWMADKRAEADALRKGFDLTELQYSDEVNGSQVEFMETAGNWSVVEEDEVTRQEVAHNAERHFCDASMVILDNLISKYKDGELELPPWVEEIRRAVNDHPQASDPVDNGSFIKQLDVSAGRKVTADQFRAFVQIVLGHPLDGVTFGEAAVLMSQINADDFEAKVIGLLS